MHVSPSASIARITARWQCGLEEGIWTDPRSLLGGDTQITANSFFRLRLDGFCDLNNGGEKIFYLLFGMEESDR